MGVEPADEAGTPDGLRDPGLWFPSGLCRSRDARKVSAPAWRLARALVDGGEGKGEPRPRGAVGGWCGEQASAGTCRKPGRGGLRTSQRVTPGIHLPAPRWD